MFEGISVLFNSPSLARTYPFRPSLNNFLRANKKQKKPKQNFIDAQIMDILDNLHKPVETWMFQKQSYLKNYYFNRAFFDLIVSYDTQQAPIGNQLSQQSNTMISVHNIFVLVVQYKVLSELLKEMQTFELEKLINAICKIYIIENKKINQDELTCVLHYILCNSKIYQEQIQKQEYSIYRPFDFHRLKHFFEAYEPINPNNPGFIDNVVNIIPMLAEFGKIIAKYDCGRDGYRIMSLIPWLKNISYQLLMVIKYDIDRIIFLKNDERCLENIDDLTKINEQMSRIQQYLIEAELENSSFAQLSKKMHQKSDYLKQTEGFVSGKTLFNYGFKQIFYLQHSLKLHKYLIELSASCDQFRQEMKLSSHVLIKLLLNCANNYDVNMQDNVISCINQMLKVILEKSNCQINGQMGIFLICPELKSEQLKDYIRQIQIDQRYKWQKTQLGEYEDDSHQFILNFEESTMFYLLNMIYNLKMEYLPLLHTILQQLPFKALEKMQFFLIKNGLLHFLIQELHTIHTNDKQTMKMYFQIVGLLLQKNTISYCILDTIIHKQLDEHSKCKLIQYTKKHFHAAKQFLQIIIADSIFINSQSKINQKYFLPLPISLLLYSNQTPTGKNTQLVSKHDIWISYIQDVIIRSLKSAKVHEEQLCHKKWKIGNRKIIQYKEINELSEDYLENVNHRQINQWMTLVIMLHIQYISKKKQPGNQQFHFAQFMMKYLTNILTQAIKWKHEDETQIIKGILNNYQEWEIYYTQMILNTDDNQDIIGTKFGSNVNFLVLKKWNRKICKAIYAFIQSVNSIEKNLTDLPF